MSELFAYQVDGAKWLSERKYALLADEQGLGKSAQAVTACALVGAMNILVVCPASMRETWRREFNRFGVARATNVMFSKIAAQERAVNIVSYDGMVNMQAALMQIPYDVVIFDEGHFLKNMLAKRTQVAYGHKGNPGLIQSSERVWLLTGTPAPNNPFELYPMCKVLFGAFSGMRKYDFIGKFCTVKNSGFGNKITGGKNLGTLKKMLDPYTLRRKKEEVLKDLPPIRFEGLYLDCGRLKLPKGLELEFADILTKLKDSDNIEEFFRRMQKDKAAVATVRRVLGMAKVGPLTEWIRDQLEGGMKKIVVFGHHTAVLDELRLALSSVSGIAYIDGSVQATQRDKEVQRFQNDPDCRIFIGQLQAAGTGLTLTAASDLVFAEYSWVPGENAQAAMRIHRIGQKDSCLIRYAIASGTLDERIGEVISRKHKTIRQIFS